MDRLDGNLATNSKETFEREISIVHCASQYRCYAWFPTECYKSRSYLVTANTNGLLLRTGKARIYVSIVEIAIGTPPMTENSHFSSCINEN